MENEQYSVVDRRENSSRKTSVEGRFSVHCPPSSPVSHLKAGIGTRSGLQTDALSGCSLDIFSASEAAVAVNLPSHCPSSFHRLVGLFYTDRRDSTGAVRI